MEFNEPKELGKVPARVEDQKKKEKDSDVSNVDGKTDAKKTSRELAGPREGENKDPSREAPKRFRSAKIGSSSSDIVNRSEHIHTSPAVLIEKTPLKKKLTLVSDQERSTPGLLNAIVKKLLDPSYLTEKRMDISEDEWKEMKESMKKYLSVPQKTQWTVQQMSRVIQLLNHKISRSISRSPSPQAYNVSAIPISGKKEHISEDQHHRPHEMKRNQFSAPRDSNESQLHCVGCAQNTHEEEKLITKSIRGEDSSKSSLEKRRRGGFSRH